MAARTPNMQRESAARRGFTIQHQKVALNIDLAGFVRGYTELTVIPNNANLRTLHLHSRQCTIDNVSVAGQPADFVLQDPQSNLGPSKPDDVHGFAEMKRKMFTAFSEADEGELSIALPPSLLPVPRSVPSEPKEGTPSTSNPSRQSNSTSEFAPISVLIHYSMRSPSNGLEFVLPTDAYPYRIPHAFTNSISPDSARCWVPCVDTLWERHSWDFEFVVPKTLGGRADDDMETDSVSDEEEEEVPVVVICTGEFVEKVAHPHDSRKTIFVYSQSAPTTVQHVAFAVGPFQVVTIPVDKTRTEPTDSEGPGIMVSSKTPMHVYCLPGLEARLRATTSFYRTAMNFFTSEYGSYPFSSHKLVFVDELATPRFEASTLSIVHNDILHGDEAIEEVFDARQSLSHALACQWVGINIIPKNWADLWLVNGLGHYITALFLRRLFGNNEYRFRLRKDMDRVVQQDRGGMPPLCVLNSDAPDGPLLAFINLKAPLVLYILDRRLAKSGTALGLSRVLPKIFLSAISGEMTNNTISTHSFLRTCRKVSAVDLRSFSDQWIYGSGCPTFTFQATFNKKKMAVELYMNQASPAYQHNEADRVRMGLLKPVQTFEGTLTIRIHEADGTPYEHVLDIRNDSKKYEILFNTKYKRVRRNTKRFLARKAAAAAAEAGDVEAAEALDMIDSGFELKEWENEARRAYWQVTDWTEEDEALMNGAAYEWIRLDADFEWIASISFEQPDYMWVSQLQRDRDVVAQLEALHALARQPTGVVSSNLTKTVLVNNYFYRVRAEAARLLIACATPGLKDIGLIHLCKLFTRYCYRPSTASDPFRSKLVPRPNDFSDFSEYFVRKSLIIAISEYRDPEGKTGPFVRRFLIDQLHYNDNIQNQYSDALYVCTLIAALGRTLLPGKVPELSELTRTAWAPDLDDEDREVLDLAVTEVERYKDLDRLNPSPHNAISIAVIEWYSMLQQASILPSDWRNFIAYSREGNYVPVRVAAFEAILLNKWFTRKSLARYIFAVIAHDSSRAVRRFVARAAVISLGIIEAVGDIRSSAKEGSEKSVLIEEDGGNGMSSKLSKRADAEQFQRAIRKDAGKQKGLRDIIVPTYLSPMLDNDTRLSILKLGEIIFRADPEAPNVSLNRPLEFDSEEALKPLVAPTPVTSIPVPTLPTPIYPPIESEPVVRAKVEDVKMAVDVGAPRIEANGGLASVGVEAPVPVPKKKKEKPIPAAQSSGMSPKDVQTCRNVLKKLNASKTSYFFRQAVDPIRDHAPGYFEKIKHPMDLSTMGYKLDNGHYTSREAFARDVDLIIANARAYNPPGTMLITETDKFQAFYERTWDQVNNTLTAMGQNSGSSKPAPPAETIKASADPSSQPLPATQVTQQVPPPAQEPVKPKIPKVSEPKVKQEAPQPKTSLPTPGPVPKPKTKTATPPVPVSAPTPAAVTPTPEPSASSSEAPAAPVKHTLKLKPPKVKVKPAAPPPPDPFLDVSDVDAVGELDDLFIEPPPSSAKTKASPSKPKPVGEDADSLLAELVDEFAAEGKPRGTPSWKKKGKEKERVEVPAARRSLLSEGSSRPASPAPSHVAAPPPVKPTAAPKRTSSNLVTNSKPAAPVAEVHPIDIKRCNDLLKSITNVQAMPEVTWFLAPVDAIASGCPTYYDEIKNPMDFQTLSSKLQRGDYKTMEAFAEDVYLIFRNCRQFNPPGTAPTIAADNVERAFRREWASFMRGRLTVTERKYLLTFLEKMRNVEDYRWFRDPVDLNILPNYTLHIPKKDMRDLGTMKTKLETNKYDSPLDGLAADVTQLAKNAHKFNGSQDLVAALASKLESEVHAELNSFRKSLKRKAASSADVDHASPAKNGSSSKSSSMNGGAHPPKKLKRSIPNGH